MKKKFIFIVTLLVALISMQCKTTQNKATFDERFNSDEFDVLILNEKNVQDHELTFVIQAKENRISGQSSCNTYGVSYENNEGKLELGFIIATKMYCDDKMELENEFLKAVGEVKKFKYSNQGEKLSLYNEEEKKIIELSKKKENE